MRVFVATDHAGFELKQALVKHLQTQGHEVIDLGAASLDQDDDYPQYAYLLATKILGEEGDSGRGILLCGSGQGMAIAANRVRGIRAAVIWNQDGARETREDNNSNVLSLPARMIDRATAFKIADTWLSTPYSASGQNARHQRRLDEIEEIYG